MLGLTYYGHVNDISGYAESNRNLISQLVSQGVQVKLYSLRIDLPNAGLSPKQLQFFQRLTQTSEDLRWPVLQSMIAPAFRVFPGRYNIGLTMIETNGLAPAWVAACNRMDEIWVPSHFNRQGFIASGVAEEKVKVMPFGVDGERFRPGLSPLDIPERKGYTFLSIFDWRPRKGFEFLLQAFSEEFTSKDDVCLVLKVSNTAKLEPARLRRELNRFYKPAPHKPKIIFLDQVIGYADMPRLYSSGDCFVLPTRGEGWNLPAIEAMASGLPVICTAWSAHLEYMNYTNSFLLNMERLEQAKPSGFWTDQFYNGFSWARPSVKHLRMLMRWVYQNRDEAKAVGAKARQDVLANFTWAHSAARIKERLNQIANSGL
ncbi:MAG: glycosyltransferase [Firmicutes bacterium]|nr:glycosyltransferase [Bacillota bacterium]